MFPGSRRSCPDRVGWALVLGVLVLNVPSSVARSSRATGQEVLLVDDRAGTPRLRDADRCVDPGSDDDAGSYCVLHPEDITAVISTAAHALSIKLHSWDRRAEFITAVAQRAIM